MKKTNDICIQEFTIIHETKGPLAFHAHLITSREIGNSKIVVKLFKEDFKLSTFYLNYIGKTSKSDIFKIDKISHSTVTEISLFNKDLIGISESSNFYENGKSYALIEFKQVRIKFNKTNNNDGFEGQNRESYFHLTKQAVKLIADEYHYNTHNIGKWNALKRKNIFRSFCKLKYKFQILFPYTGGFHKGDESVEINQNPVLHIKYNFGDFDFFNVISIIKLLGFYLTENIDFHFAYFKTENHKIEIHRNLNVTSNRTNPKHCQHSDYQDIYEFLKSIKDKSYILNNHQNLHLYIENFVHAKKLSPSARFMVYYSIFEGIRNEFIAKHKIDIQEKFTFLQKPNKSLKDNLIHIADSYLKKNEVDFFKDQIGSKIKEIKRYPMKLQLESFLKSKHIEVDLAKFNLDLTELLEFRNNLFHGNFNFNEERLIQVNSDMEELAAKMIRLLLKAKDERD